MWIFSAENKYYLEQTRRQLISFAHKVEQMMILHEQNIVYRAEDCTSSFKWCSWYQMIYFVLSQAIILSHKWKQLQTIILYKQDI